jgi:hypothetical protein
MRIARKFWHSILRSVTVNRTSKACDTVPMNISIDAVTWLKVWTNLTRVGPVGHPLEEAVFIRQADYWTIHYRGQTAIPKATQREERE